MDKIFQKKIKIYVIQRATRKAQNVFFTNIVIFTNIDKIFILGGVIATKL